MILKRLSPAFALIELLLAVAAGSVLLLVLGNLALSALTSYENGREKKELIYQASFAMERMVGSVRNTRRLLVPLTDDINTAFDESMNSALAVTLDPLADRDNNGIPDADNDGDGLIDEDIPADNTNDGAGGIVAIDDNNDGVVDTVSAFNNDEDQLGGQGEDWLNNKDDDGDGSKNEDIPGGNSTNSGPVAFDNDGDGGMNEDWLDVVVFYVNPAGTGLVERLPNVNPVDGNDYTERIIAEASIVTFSVVRDARQGNIKDDLVTISITLTGETGKSVTLQTKVRPGGSSG